MLRSLKLRTKLALIVVIPVIAALIVAVPGFRSRRQELNRVENAQALLAPATAVTDFLTRLQDEGSLSAWWVASADPAVKERLASARVETDRAARQLDRAADAAADHGAPVASNRIRALRDSVALMSQERQFVDLRIAPDDSVLGYYRELDSETNSAIDAFVRAPREAAAVTMFRDLATLARLESGAADERSILSVGYSRLRLTDPQLADLVAAVTLQRASSDALLGQGREPTRRIVTDGMRDFSAATDQVKQRRATALTTRQLAPDVTPAEWFGSATRQMAGWGTIGTRLKRDIDADLENRADDAQSALTLYAVGALAVLLLAGGLAVIVARSIRRPLRKMADNAHEVATQQLPALVDALNDETVVPPTITPLVVRSRDEIGALAKAFNHVERTTVEVAELQRQAVRSGISDLYVNLARRNQPLLSRQLALIEDLEREERDPDRLGTLFTLDHLATRMRRNSDSLLVLAGQDDLLASPIPVALLDVVRGAVSETAEFGRIDTAGIPREVEVVGYAAPDLAHAVSELLENATSFSPPASRVVVAARRIPTGIELTITDEGIGIAAPRVDAINQTLAKPPLPGLAMSSSLGLIVVARLAHRIGVQVTLRSAPDVGTAAVLQLPDSILRTAGDPVPGVTVPSVADTGAPMAIPAPTPAADGADIDLTDDADSGEAPVVPVPQPWTRPARGRGSARAERVGSRRRTGRRRRSRGDRPAPPARPSSSTPPRPPGANRRSPPTDRPTPRRCCRPWCPFRRRRIRTPARHRPASAPRPARPPTTYRRHRPHRSEPPRRPPTPTSRSRRPDSRAGRRTGRRRASRTSPPRRRPVHPTPCSSWWPATKPAGAAPGPDRPNPPRRSRNERRPTTPTPSRDAGGAGPASPALPSHGAAGVRPHGRERVEMSSVTSSQDLGFLLTNLVEHVPGIREAAVVSSDGLLIALSQGVDRATGDRLAAVAAGLMSVSRGAGVPMRAGAVHEVIVELEFALIVVMGISDGSALAVVATRPCDVGLVAYEMAMLADRAGAALTPQLVTDLRQELPA